MLINANQCYLMLINAIQCCSLPIQSYFKAKQWCFTCLDPRCRCVVVSLLIKAESMLIEAIRCRSLLIETCFWAPLPMRRCIAANQFQVSANRCNSLQICYSMLLNAIQCCSLPIQLYFKANRWCFTCLDPRCRCVAVSLPLRRCIAANQC